MDDVNNTYLLLESENYDDIFKTFINIIFSKELIFDSEIIQRNISDIYRSDKFLIWARAIIISQHNQMQAIPLLISFLDEKDDDLIRCSLIILGYFKNKSASKLFNSIMINENYDLVLRCCAASTLGRIGNNNSIPLLKNS